MEAFEPKLGTDSCSPMLLVRPHASGAASLPCNCSSQHARMRHTGGEHSWKAEQGSGEAGGAPPDQHNLKPRLKGGGAGPHLEPSSLPFLSNSVETLRCIRQEDKENKIDVDWTFSLQSLRCKQKMRQRCETTTQNKTTP